MYLLILISYNLFISDWIFFYSRFDLFQAKPDRFHDLHNAELNDNFMRQPLVSIDLNICIPL